jgi:hypothetical protein
MLTASKSWLAVAWFLGWAALGGGAVWAQEEEETLPPDSESFAGDEDGAVFGGEGDQQNFDAIDDLLREDEEVRSDPKTFGYDPGTRRDPFRSLIVQREQPEETSVVRPEGIAGLLIDEIQIEGVFELPEGPVAQIKSASHDTSYLLRPGDQLWDGDVVSIDLQEVTFKQVVTDTTALKPFQQVVKQLNP